MARAKLLFGMAATAAIFISTAASAAVVNVSIGGVALAGAGQTSAFGTTYDFNVGPAPFTGTAPAGNLLFTDSSSGNYAAPFGDATHYVSVGTSQTPQR